MFPAELAARAAELRQLGGQRGRRRAGPRAAPAPARRYARCHWLILGCFMSQMCIRLYFGIPSLRVTQLTTSISHVVENYVAR